MATINLTAGDHVIEWSMDGYETLTAEINVSAAGVISCFNVVVGTCQDKITIVGNTITALLTAVLTTPNNICEWIENRGGPNSLMTYDIMELVREYIQPVELEFTVTTAYIMGAVAYYSGEIPAGNALTGCDY